MPHCSLAYLCSEQGILPDLHPENEEGILCESGTMPVAVNPDEFPHSFATASAAGGKAWGQDKSEDLPCVSRPVPSGQRQCRDVSYNNVLQ